MRRESEKARRRARRREGDVGWTAEVQARRFVCSSFAPLRPSSRAFASHVLARFPSGPLRGSILVPAPARAGGRGRGGDARLLPLFRPNRLTTPTESTRGRRRVHSRHTNQFLERHGLQATVVPEFVA